MFGLRGKRGDSGSSHQLVVFILREERGFIHVAEAGTSAAIVDWQRSDFERSSVFGGSVAIVAEAVEGWCLFFEQNAGAFMLLRPVHCRLAVFSLQASVGA